MRATLRVANGLAPSISAAVGLLALSTCTSSPYVHLYETQPFAPSYTAADVASMKYMGATLTDDGINFAVYSENATKIQVLLFDKATDGLPSQQFDLTPQGSVWSVWVSGIGLNQMYGFRAWGPNWPYDPSWTPGTITGFISDVDSSGNRFNPNKLLVDPYSQMVTGPFNWAEASAASGPDRTIMTYAAAGKSMTVQSQYQWSANETQWVTARQNPNMPGHRLQDLIVYETHPKGFTASTASTVQHPGTFRGIGENAAYFKDLGITAVELMPSMLKSTDGGYWGYDTIGFFIPEMTYVALMDPNNPASPIDEFKWMVDQLHQNGIEVFMDVVFNHTGEGGLWQSELQQDDVPPLADGDPNLIAFDPKEVASMLSFRGLDDQSWYCLSADGQTYWNNSGVGQDARANHAPMAHLIIDSLHFWVSQMHVDGFRFDEAAILGEPDSPGNFNGWVPKTSVLQTIIDDPILQAQNTRIVAEPWSGGGDLNGQFPASTTLPGYSWGEWNGPFRDYWRSLVNCDGSTGIYPDGCDATNMSVGTAAWTPLGNLATAGFELYGSQGLFQPNGRKVTASYNFVTIHDGMTLYDLFSFDQKENACGPLNPACCTDQVFTSECAVDDGTTSNISRDWGQDHEDVKREMMRDLFTLLLVSNGTPLLLGGDEWMRTQLGNNNAYSSLADNASNWYDWGSWEPSPEKNRMHDFVRQLISLRKQFGYALAPPDYGAGVPVSWEDNVAGQPANWNSRHLAVHYPKSDAGPELEILMNFETGVPGYSSNGGPLLGTQTCPGASTYFGTSPTGYDGVCVCTQNSDCPNGGTCQNNVCQMTFTLPDGNWSRLVDTQTYFDEDSYFDGGVNPALSANASANASVGAPLTIPGNSYTVEPHSIVILENTASSGP